MAYIVMACIVTASIVMLCMGITLVGDTEVPQQCMQTTCAHEMCIDMRIDMRIDMCACMLRCQKEK